MAEKIKSILDQFLNLDQETESSNQEYSNQKSEESSFTSNELKSLGEEIISAIKAKIPEAKFKAYFENTFKIIQIESDQIIAQVSTKFIKTTLENHYLDFLNQAVESALGKAYQLILTLNESAPQQEPIKSVKKASFRLDEYTHSLEEQKHNIQSQTLQKQQGSRILGVIRDKKFENFIVGPSNSMAFATAVAIAKEPGKTYPSVYLHGPSGLGKTHLIHAVANKVSELFPNKRIIITSANAFKMDVIHAIKNNRQNEFKDKYTNQVDVLIIDDIHELANREGTQQEFFHIFNELHKQGKQLIFTSDKHPKDILGITERIKTRLSWGLVLEIQRPEFETRIAILKKKALEIDLFLTDDIIELIAKNIKTNIRELEGSLVQLFAYSSINNIDIDIDIAKEQLRLSDTPEEKILTIEDIAKISGDYFGVSIEELQSKSRLKEIATARHMAMYLCYDIVKATQKEIAEYFGGRDHTTVLHAIKKIKDGIKNNPEILKQYHQIKGQL